MSIKAGDKCVQCPKDKEKGILRYEGKDKANRDKTFYQRILKCTKCSWEVTETQTRTY